jgi:phosphohistidine phosphatase
VNLYFLRHGPAGDREDWHDDDRLRPLTEDGKDKMEKTGETIASLNLGIDLVVTSPLTRAVQTAKIVSKELKLNKSLVEDERLAPGFNKELLSQIINDHPDVDGMLLVGHEPDFSETVRTLIGGGEIIFKKGGLARVDILDKETLTGQLVWIIPPKLLTR